MERVSTGVAGIDAAVGGYPKGRSVLISGRSGSGKTILSLQFAQACAAEGRRVLFIAVRERREDLLEAASAFGWPFDSYEAEKRVHFMTVSDARGASPFMDGREVGFTGIVEALGNVDALVIDNLGALALEMSISHFRQQIDYLLGSALAGGVTMVATCDEGMVHRFGDVAEQAFDTIVRLSRRDIQYVDRKERYLEFVKMRFTAAPIDAMTFRIGPKGIELS